MSLVRAAPLLALTGCATLFAGGPDHVPVLTNPPGAFVYLNGVPVGQTPMELQLDRDVEARIQIYLPGFAPVQLFREKEFNTWFIGSIVLFALIVPPIVDLVTGDHRRYDNTPIALGLTPLAAPPYPQPQPYPPAPAPPPAATPTSQPPLTPPPAAPPPPKR